MAAWCRVRAADQSEPGATSINSIDAAAGARFRTIYTSHLAAIVAYALRRTENPDDAADAAAETFLIAWRRLDDVPNGEATLPWLYGTARRVLANQRRGVRRRARLSEMLAAELRNAAAAFEPPAVRDDSAARAFRRLPAEQQDLLGLVAWEQLGPRELAAVLGCSPNAAKLRLYRARRAYERLLESAGASRNAAARSARVTNEEAAP